MNVVHAGLDILRGELKAPAFLALPSLKEIVELVEDIFISSESAINLLSDLLNYEHIDAGSEVFVGCDSEI